MKRSRLFTDDELKALEGFIQDAESRTAGEIVVVAAPASGGYRWVWWMWGSLGAVTVSFVLWALSLKAAWSLPTYEILALQALGAFGGACLPLWDRLRRATIARFDRAEHVHRATLANFTAAGLHETRDRTGVLIYLSELEHCVEILADRGIHSKVGETFWKEEVELIARAIREGRAFDGLKEAIEGIGKKLTEHFPARPDDKNELANRVRLGHQDPSDTPK